MNEIPVWTIAASAIIYTITLIAVHGPLNLWTKLAISIPCIALIIVYITFSLFGDLLSSQARSNIGRGIFDVFFLWHAALAWITRHYHIKVRHDTRN